MIRALVAILTVAVAAVPLLLPRAAQACTPMRPSTAPGPECRRVTVGTPLSQPLPVNTLALALAPGVRPVQSLIDHPLEVVLLDEAGGVLETWASFTHGSDVQEVIRPDSSRIAADASYRLRYEEWCSAAGTLLGSPEKVEVSFTTRDAAPLPETAGTIVAGPVETVRRIERRLEPDCFTTEHEVRMAEATFTLELDPSFVPHLALVRWELRENGFTLATGRGVPSSAVVSQRCDGGARLTELAVAVTLDGSGRMWSSAPFSLTLECEDGWEQPMGCAAGPAPGAGGLSTLGLLLVALGRRRR